MLKATCSRSTPRRSKLHGTVEYLIVLQEGVKARLAAEGNDRMEDLSNHTAQEVVDDRLNLAEDWGPRKVWSPSPRRT